MTTDNASPDDDRYSRFVNYVLKRAATDKGFAAKLRRADNPSTASQSWDILLALGIDINKENELRAFALIGAALCKAKASQDGSLNLGAALRISMDIKEKSVEEAPPRLRRLLACTSQEELCHVLRPLLQYILAHTSSTHSPLDFSLLLKQVRWFGQQEESTTRTRLSWISSYYHPSPQPSDDVPLPS